MSHTVEQNGDACRVCLVLVAACGDDRRRLRERVFRQRHEVLDVNLPAGQPDLLEGQSRTSHEGLGPTDERLETVVRLQHRLQRCGCRQPLHVLEPVQDGQTVGMFGEQFTQGGSEDHRSGVTIGVKEHHSTGAIEQCRLDDGEQRGDSAAGADQQQIPVEILRCESARRDQTLDDMARGDVVAQPIRPVTVDRSLHRHPERVVVPRCARERIASCDRPGALTRDPQREELPGPVSEPVARVVENDRLGVGGLGDDLPDRQCDRAVHSRPRFFQSAFSDLVSRWHGLPPVGIRWTAKRPSSR